jgi:hypothetical protein
MSQPTPKTLVYGVFQADELAFIPKQQALDLAQLWRALDSAQTWADFKRMVPDHVYAGVVELIQDSPGSTLSDAGPDPQAPFDRDDIPGHADGDWPPFPPQQMLDWVPQEIQARYGRTITTVFNGDYLCFAANDAADIVRALEQHGYTCEPNENLVKDATGH